MVLLVMAIAAIACRARVRALRHRAADGSADKMLGLLRDARKASIDFNATVTLRIDPKTLKYQLDTTRRARIGTSRRGHAGHGADRDARDRSSRG